MNYQEFIENKKHRSIDFGIDYTYMPDCLFDYQKYITEYAIKKGRCAGFIDTGLGKTLIELVIARNYAEQTNKPVLIITPLAVAFQFIKESNDFDIADIQYSKDGKYKSDIVVCNYERLDKFNPDDFDCVILDESSILKNFDGATKTAVTTFLKNVKYRYLFTATPSPNDFIELGTSSEALGYMGYMDVLKTYFANNENNIRPQHIATKWYLKPHATNDFFNFISSWSISMRKPSDFGFSDKNHILPKLNVNDNYVKNPKNFIDENGQVEFFQRTARTMTEVRIEQKETIQQRCEKAVELAGNHETSVYWCNFNYESEMIDNLDNDAVQLVGSMSLDKKEDILINFSNGQIKKLITKPKITCFGLNWQHCSHTVFFPTWSFEQYYQAIRRFWRFGQKNNVIVDRVISEGQSRVIDALEMKKNNAEKLFDKLNINTNNKIKLTQDSFNKKVEIPNFMRT